MGSTTKGGLAVECGKGRNEGRTAITGGGKEEEYYRRGPVGRLIGRLVGRSPVGRVSDNGLENT